MKLTDRKIRALGPGEHVDDGLPGLSLRISPATGRAVFALRYRVGRVRRRVVIGRYPVVTLADARLRARALLGAVASGADPADDRDAARRAETVADVLDLFLDSLSLQRDDAGRWVPIPRTRPRRRTWRETARLIDREIRPVLGKLRAKDVRRLDVLALRDAIDRRGAPVLANRVVSLVGRVFAFALDVKIVESSPAARIKPLVERSRERVLTETEIRDAWAWSETLAPLPRAHVRLLLLLGQRTGETVSMRVEDIDGDTWTIPPERSKSGREHRVPLPPQAIAVLESIRELAHGGYAFPSPAGGHMRRRNLNKLLARHRDRLRARGVQPPDWTPHDARRTLATGLASWHVDRLTISRVLGHSMGHDVMEVYDRSDRTEAARRALTLWADHVERVVSGRAADEKVVGRIGA